MATLLYAVGAFALTAAWIGLLIWLVWRMIG